MVEAGTTIGQEQALRSRIRDLLGADLIKSYRGIDLSYTLRDAYFIYFLIFATIGAIVISHLNFGLWTLLSLPVAAVIFGVAFNWINVQLHEGSHQFLLRGRLQNDVYCDVALGAWGLQDVETYRATHGMHHAHLHTDRDPDLDVYTTHVGSFRQLLRGIVDDLTLKAAFRRRRQVAAFIAANNLSCVVPHYAAVAKIVAQAIVLGLLVWGCGPLGVAYAGAYAYGLLGVFPVLVRIRTVVQHYDDRVSTPEETPSAAFISRTTVASLLEFVLVGARMDYHFEHHLFPTLPYYGLRRMHEALAAAGFFLLPTESIEPQFQTETYVKAYVDLAGHAR